MAFAGKYQTESQENFAPFMKALGLSDDVIEKTKDTKSIIEIEENGDNFKITTTTGTHVLVNSFTVGQESDFDTLTGEKVKAVMKREGNKLTTNLKGIDVCSEVVGDKMTSTYCLGAIVFKTVSKRI